MSSKLSKTASDRLLNLLYTTAQKEVTPKVPIVNRYLYEEGRKASINEDAKSFLDGLVENQWKQRSLEEAMKDIEVNKATHKPVNVLSFRCPNQLVTFDDFYNIYPINRERKYYLGNDLRNGVKFEVIKARDPCTLLHNGLYYLIFPNYKHACVYLMETKGKHLNGFDLKFNFVDVNKELMYMSSPWYDIEASSKLPKNFYKSSLAKKNHMEIFKGLDEKLEIIKEINSASKRSPEDIYKAELDPLYTVLSKFIDKKRRISSVLVRNLPFGLSKFALPKLLWDYDLAPLARIDECFVNIVNDPLLQTHITLIRFADAANANRFVRTFHGRKWESIQTEKEKKLYDPILCEVLD